MRRALIVIVTVMATSSGASVASMPAVAAGAPARMDAAKVDPILERRLANAGPGAMVDLIVVLTTQADPQSIPGAKRPERLAGVEHTLRSVASATQGPLRTFLEARMDQGLVARFVPLWVFNGIEVRATESVVEELAARADVRTIRANRTISAPEPTAPSATADAPTEANVAVINAPQMWDLGFRGQGVVVANMDTGVDVTHPELSGRWRGGTNSWFDPYGEHPTTPTDVNGHGTETMGVMVGGAAGGTSLGVAPDATWIAVKIFDDHGEATSNAIHLGFQWLLDPDGNPSTADAPNVVNNSWSASFGCNLDFQLDLQSLRTAGILPIFAAGNSGPNPGTSRSPANNPEAFAVGATDDADAIDPSSARGPSACGGGAYPHVTAPGVGIRTTDLHGSYSTQTGSSLAAPHVAGALALLLDAVPNLPADRQAAALERGALDLGTTGPDTIYGYGRVDVAAAYGWLSTPDFTFGASPLSKNRRPGEAASYKIAATGFNGFSDDVTLSLDGLPKAVGAASFDPGILAEGTGGSLLTVSLSPKATPGTYPMNVVGSSGAMTHVVPVTMIVTPRRDFSIMIDPSSITVRHGRSASFTLTLAALGGFDREITVSVKGLPTGSTVTVGPDLIIPVGTSTLTVRTSRRTPRGRSTLTITGRSGHRIHRVEATLVVH